jgi:uncharacterized membrane protein YphA (DoxX/SURF4 family)
LPAWFRRILPYSWPIRVALGFMFLYSSSGKLGDLAAVVENVRQYKLLPEPLPIPFGYALPFGELALGIMLLLGIFTRLAAAGGSLLMIGFMIAIAFSLLRGGAQPDCGCFALSAGETLSWATFGRDVVFLVGLMLPLLDRAHLVSLDRFLFGAGTDPEATTVEEPGSSDVT